MKYELNNLKPQPRCVPVNLLNFLEAENSRLRRTVIELSLDVLVLRDALNGNGLPAQRSLKKLSRFIARGTNLYSSDCGFRRSRSAFQFEASHGSDRKSATCRRSLRGSDG
jgi:hypothetical protein